MQSMIIMIMYVFCIYIYIILMYIANWELDGVGDHFSNYVYMIVGFNHLLTDILYTVLKSPTT